MNAQGAVFWVYSRSAFAGRVFPLPWPPWGRKPNAWAGVVPVAVGLCGSVPMGDSLHPFFFQSAWRKKWKPGLGPKLGKAWPQGPGKKNPKFKSFCTLSGAHKKCVRSLVYCLFFGHPHPPLGLFPLCALCHPPPLLECSHSCACSPSPNLVNSGGERRRQKILVGPQ